MTKVPRVSFTHIQKNALELLKSNAKHVFLYGGSRSGKTYVIVEYCFRMCLKHSGLRVFIARHAFAHVKSSIWQETLSDVIHSYYKKYPDQQLFVLNHTDLSVKFVNGSEIYLAGLDNKERVEKILGREFGIIYLNECSQIDYGSVSITKTRLAQKIPGFVNKFIYDANPPAPTHWVSKMFMKKVEPKTDEPLFNPKTYVSMLMNPKDNMENLPEDYLEVLEALPDRERRRFLYGEFVSVEGAIFDKFDVEQCKMDINDIPQFESFAIGMDNNSGARMHSCLIGFAGEHVYVLDEWNQARVTHTEFNAEIYTKWAQYNPLVYPDPAAGALNDYVWNAQKTNNSVEPGINCLREKIEFGKFHIITKNGEVKAPTLVKQMESYHLDDNGRIYKHNDDSCDALRYAVFTYYKYGASILLK